MRRSSAPSTRGVALINLANLYWNTGRLAEAEPLFQRFLGGIFKNVTF